VSVKADKAPCSPSLSSTGTIQFKKMWSCSLPLTKQSFEVCWLFAFTLYKNWLYEPKLSKEFFCELSYLMFKTLSKIKLICSTKNEKKYVDLTISLLLTMPCIYFFQFIVLLVNGTPGSQLSTPRSGKSPSPSPTSPGSLRKQRVRK